MGYHQNEVPPPHPERADTDPGPTARTLRRHAALEPDDLAVLEAALEPAEHIAAGAVLGDRAASQVFTLIDGWAGLERTGPNGRRQVLTLFLPGDIVGLDTATAPLSTGQIVSLTVAKIRRLTSRGRALLVTRPRLLQAIAAHNLDHQARLQDQIYRVGALSAAERVADLLSEVHGRISALSPDGRCIMPIKQEIMSQVLGLSLVHINRTLKTLSQQRLAWLDRGRLVVPDSHALRIAGGA